MRVFENVLELVGNTPLVRLNRTAPAGVTVLAKLESMNPGGSVKDRIGITLVRAAEKAGLQPGGLIVEGTSGNTGVGLALAASVKGYRCIFTMPDKMALEKERLLQAYGAEVVRCPYAVEPDDPRSYYEVAKKLAKEGNGIYPNQYVNPENPWAHYYTTGPEIWGDTDGTVTHFVAGVGTGGTISGTGRFLKEQNPKLRVLGVDPRGSILSHYKATRQHGDAKPYLVEGIGEDIIPETVWWDWIDDFVTVEDDESFRWAERLAHEEAILAGGSAGSALAGVHRLVEDGRIPQGSTVVLLVPDRGERYLSKVFDRGWRRAVGAEPPARTVAEAMIRPCPTVAPDDALNAFLLVASARGVDTVPVVDGVVVGRMSALEVRKRALQGTRLDEPVRRHMGPPLKTVAPEQALEEAARLLQTEAAVVAWNGTAAGLLDVPTATRHLGLVP